VRRVRRVRHVRVLPRPPKITPKIINIQAVLATNIISKTVLDWRKALNALGEVNDVTISWIKSHVEHPGNDLADKQAKAGTIPRQGPSAVLGIGIGTQYQHHPSK
jgi:hypothetical protein